MIFSTVKYGANVLCITSYHKWYNLNHITEKSKVDKERGIKSSVTVVIFSLLPHVLSHCGFSHMDKGQTQVMHSCPIGSSKTQANPKHATHKKIQVTARTRHHLLYLYHRWQGIIPSP